VKDDFMYAKKLISVSVILQF